MLSIIIVNYNGEQFIGPCLKSIQQHVSCEYEVIVVDNASIDGSVEYLRNNYQDITLLESKENKGFTGGNNLGVEKAHGDILFLLNNDTKLLSDLKPAVDIFSTSERVGVVGCKMFYGNGRMQPSMGYEHTPLRIVLSWVGMKRFTIFPDIFRRENINSDDYNHYQNSVAWVSGASLMTRRSIWRQLGGLDTRYFMYMEDVDYCKRVNEIDYDVAYTPEVQLIHYEGSGKPWIGEDALLRTSRSYLIYSKKFQGIVSQWLLRISIVIIFMVRSTIYALLAIGDGNHILIEKRDGYIRAALRLIRLDVEI